MSNRTIGAISRRLIGHLNGLSEMPALEAWTLLSRRLERPLSWLLAHPEASITPEHVRCLEEDICRLTQGEPLPYILGSWEFFGLDFKVTPEVLIPRPETELLVEQALRWLQAHPDQRHVADVGTGSGCIGISLAVHVSDLQVWATDISPSALEVTRHNAGYHGVASRIETICCDVLPSQPMLFDVIVANLPYIPTATLRRLPIYGREPSLALDGGDDGLRLIRRLLAMAPPYLSPGGAVFLEIEASQGAKVLSLAARVFKNAAIRVLKDLAGRDRVLEIETRLAR